MRINPIQPAEVQKKSVAKKLAGAVVTTAAITGAGIYLSKSGKLDKIVNTAKEKLGQSELLGSLKNKFDTVQTKVKESVAKVANNPKVAATKALVVDKAKLVAEKAVNAFKTVKTFVSAGFKSAGQFISNVTKKAN